MIKVSNNLDQDQVKGLFGGPDVDLNCLQRLSLYMHQNSSLTRK